MQVSRGVLGGGDPLLLIEFAVDDDGFALVGTDPAQHQQREHRQVDRLGQKPHNGPAELLIMQSRRPPRAMDGQVVLGREQRRAKADRNARHRVGQEFEKAQQYPSGE